MLRAARSARSAAARGDMAPKRATAGVQTENKKSFVEVKRWAATFMEDGWRSQLIGLSWKNGMVEEEWKWMPPIVKIRKSQKKDKGDKGGKGKPKKNDKGGKHDKKKGKPKKNDKK